MNEFNIGDRVKNTTVLNGKEVEGIILDIIPHPDFYEYLIKDDNGLTYLCQDFTLELVDILEQL